MMVNYEILHRSTKFYQSKGYRRIEAPWLVSHEISDITRPKDRENYRVTKSGTDKVFVASGEQSFLYLINKGYLAPGSYQTITPCMRNESFDETHLKYFMKNELIHFDDNRSSSYLGKVIDDAREFFSLYFDKHDLGIEKTDDGWDIVHLPSNTELGSYGVRECSFVKWVYGTGVAEPRFSRTLKMEG